MISPDEVSILSDLEKFVGELEYYRFSRLPIVAARLHRRQVLIIANLRIKLLRDIGRYRSLITELIGREEPQIAEKANLHSTDLWLKGLELQFDLTAAQALDYCIDITHVAIGKLEDDIRKGYRDKQGRPIERPIRIETEPPKGFISHGRKSIALTKVEEFLRTLGIEPLIVERKPSLDKTLSDKVDFYLNLADFVVVLATGDDKIEGKLHPRQNIVHEAGLAQKIPAGKIIYLLEENCEFPSNIKPKVWEIFNQDNMENVFPYIVADLKEFGILKTMKP